MKTRIIYEDDDVLVIRKPAGLATQTAKIGQPDVVSELKNYLSGSAYIGVVHRLDQPVEGLLVFAKNKKSAAELTRQLQDKSGQSSLNKHYYAVFCGKPEKPQGEFVDFIVKKKDNKAEIIEVVTDKEEQNRNVWFEANNVLRENMDSRKGDEANGDGLLCRHDGPERNGKFPSEVKSAVLNYQVMKTIAAPGGEEISLADVTIRTGRFHQIRCQMAYHGIPLLGDRKYADEKAGEVSAKLGVRSVALCAYQIEFFHPTTKRKMEFTIEPEGGIFSLFKA